MIVCSHLDPTLLAESDPELFGHFISSLLGSSVTRAAATRLSVHFHSAANDQTHRIATGNSDDRRQRRAWGFASAGVNRAGSEFAQSLRRHLLAFDRR
jgi:hypothetical protein